MVVVVVLAVMLKHGLRTKMFSMPFCTKPLKLDESEAKAMDCPVVQRVTMSELQPLMLGDSLSPLPGVVPSGEDAMKVVGMQVGGVVSMMPVQVSRR